MNKLKILLSILGILFGAFMFVYGEYDDSPGGQLMGVVLIVIGIWFIVRGGKKNSDQVK